MSETKNFGPGNVLRTKREEYEWSIEAVADALHLPVSHIDAIENDRYEDLPGSTYIIGYWRSYARVLGIDIEDTIEANKRNVIEDEYEDVVMPSQEGMHMAGSKSGSLGFLATMFILLSLVVGGLWYAWQQGSIDLDAVFGSMQSSDQVETEQAGSESLAIEGVTTETVELESEPEPEPEPVMVAIEKKPQPAPVAGKNIVSIMSSTAEGLVAEAQEVQKQVIDGQVVDQASAIEKAILTPPVVKQSEPASPAADAREAKVEATKPKAEAETIAKAEPAVPVEPVDPKQISLILAQDSWLDVRDRTLKRLIYRSETGGQTIKLKGQPPFYVYIGTPTGVKVQYLGKDVPFDVHKSGLFARFKIGEKDS